MKQNQIGNVKIKNIIADNKLSQIIVQSEMQGNNLVSNLDIRYIQSEFLKSSQFDMSTLYLVEMESSLDYISSKLDFLRENWEKFYRHYRINMEILKDSYPSDIELSTDLLNFI